MYKIRSIFVFVCKVITSAIIKHDCMFFIGCMEARLYGGNGFLMLQLGRTRIYLPAIEYRTKSDDRWFYVA